jgi:hypothetical protein
MKRFLTVAVVGVLGAALLIACGGSEKPANSPAGAASSSAPAAPDSAAPATSAT